MCISNKLNLVLSLYQQRALGVQALFVRHGPEREIVSQRLRRFPLGRTSFRYLRFVTARVVVLTFDNHNPPPLSLWAACITIQCVVLRWLKFQRHTNKQRLLWHWNALQNKLFDSAYLEVWSNRCYMSLKYIVHRCARYCYKQEL